MKEEKTAINSPLKSDPATWVEQYADYLYRFAFSRLRNEEIARDLIQDTFLAALQQVSRFEGKSSEKTWLTGILKNKIADFYRRQASKSITEIRTAEIELQNFFDADNGHWNMQHSPKAFGLDDNDPMLLKELGGILNDCLKKLPALWLSVFSMKHMDDLTSEKICIELKLTGSNFWVIMHRTKLNLRACLQKHWN
ncbi:sigma-70 family RNA polymerase sigma factor [Pedobacter hartonius]|uniref:RNA polymerase sigma-70 factor, ECF subfamily n=1 Tax=Pedobacter hartonius TaxID=425514 RepID=A0A1H4HGN0_9SPHI|nr:sigma-70 family RNA polymerase sigma factor [Pedobacter hartonius]SEB20964.1 RNA polymerase sigma-70 factor, ECF subfamily [Pedobacter hartonius]